MTILSKTIGSVGQVGVVPRRIQFVVTDLLAVVIAAGYLQPDHLYPDTIQPTDIIDMYYGATSLNAPGTYGEFLVSITAGVITLVQAEGSVALPTIVNHIATYNSVAGGLGEDASTAINGGNIQAGLSGTAGYVASFPSTAAKGSLHVTAVANTGDTLTTISNVAMGQASVVSIPDPANAVGRFLVGATATPFTSGHIVASSGTGGLVVDSGLATTAVQLNTNIKAVRSSDIGGAGAGPITITLAGVVATSVIVASIVSSSNTVSIAKVTPGTGNFTVLFSGDPGAACVLNYLVFIAQQ